MGEDMDRERRILMKRWISMGVGLADMDREWVGDIAYLFKRGSRF